jgi:hypothetical protein
LLACFRSVGICLAVAVAGPTAPLHSADAQDPIRVARAPGAGEPLALRVALASLGGARGAGPPTPELREIEALLGLGPMLARLAALRVPPPRTDATAEEAEGRSLSLRWEIASRLLAAGFEVDRVIAAIDRERAGLEELAAWSRASQERQARRERRAALLPSFDMDLGLGVLALGAALGTGLGAFDETARAGAIVGTLAGVLGADTSLLTGGERARAPVAVPSRMLGPCLGEAPDALYPPFVWRYLTQVPAGGTESRRDRLVAGWRRGGHVPPGVGLADQERIADLAEPLSPGRVPGAAVLADRQAMLTDLRAEVASLRALINRALTMARAE